MGEDKNFKSRATFKIPGEKSDNYIMVATTVSQKTIDWVLSNAIGIKPITTRHFLGEIVKDINGVFIQGMKIKPKDPTKTIFIPNDVLIFSTILISDNVAEALKNGRKKITEVVDSLAFNFKIGLEIQNNWIVFELKELGSEINIHYDLRSISVSGSSKSIEIERIIEYNLNSPDNFPAIISMFPEKDTDMENISRKINTISRTDFDDIINETLSTVEKSRENNKLSMALRFYRTMRGDPDIIYSFLSLWRALEILSDQDDEDDTFSREERGKINEMINISSRSIEDKNRLKGYIFKAHSKGRIDSMIQNLGLSNTDKTILNKMRDLRGKIIHPQKFPDEEEILESYNAGLIILNQSIHNLINEQNRSEQGGFPQEIGPAQERKGGRFSKPD